MLHRILVAALVRVFLTLCGLHRIVACSDRHLHGRVNALLRATGAWGDAQRATTAAAMPHRTIGVCTDETFHDGMLLVAQEPVFGFLLVEKRSDRRDADTWNQAVKEGLADLPVTICS